MKVTIICHLATIYLDVATDINAAKWKIIVTFMHYIVNLLKYEVCNRIWQISHVYSLIKP